MLRFTFHGWEIQISTLLFFVCPLLFARGYAAAFACWFVALSLHELAHILVSRRFGLRPAGILLTPAGMAAILPGTESLTTLRRLTICLAGPVISLTLAGLCALLPMIPDAFLRANLTLCLFNLLPLCPLDGGRAMEILAERILGAANASCFIRALSVPGIVLLFILGFAQIILFFPNPSLLCAALYLRQAARAEADARILVIYRDLVVLGVKNSFRRPLAVITLSVLPDTPVKTAYRRLNWDSFCVYQLRGTAHSVSEADLCAYIRENGLRGTLLDCISLHNMV